MSGALWGRNEDNLSNFYLEAARGQIVDTFTIHKFGLATGVDTGDPPVDVWDGLHDDLGFKVGTYNWIDDGPVDLQVSSSSTADTGILLEGQGLDENWDLQTGTVTIQGQTPVPIGLQRNRVFRAYNKSATPLVGVVYVSDLGSALTAGVPDDKTTIRAIIHPESQQTQMALFTVPRNHELYITHGWASIARGLATAAIADCRIYRRSFGGIFRAVHTFSLATTGNSNDHRPYTIPIKFEEKEDIVYRINSVSTNNLGVSAGFHGVIIKK
jgi:hypothetical protein